MTISLNTRLLSTAALALLSAVAAAQTPPNAASASTLAYPGTNTYGSLASFAANDANGYGMTSERDPSYGQRAAYGLAFSGVSRTAATLRVTHKASVNTAALFGYFWNWSTGAYEYVTFDGAPTTSYSTQTLVLTSAQLAKYVDASGNVRLILQADVPTRLGTAPFN